MLLRLPSAQCATTHHHDNQIPLYSTTGTATRVLRPCTASQMAMQFRATPLTHTTQRLRGPRRGSTMVVNSSSSDDKVVLQPALNTATLCVIHSSFYIFAHPQPPGALWLHPQGCHPHRCGIDRAWVWHVLWLASHWHGCRHGWQLCAAGDLYGYLRGLDRQLPLSRRKQGTRVGRLSLKDSSGGIARDSYVAHHTLIHTVIFSQWWSIHHNDSPCDTQQMTYVQQLKDYEEAVMVKRMEELPPGEQERLIEVHRGGGVNPCMLEDVLCGHAYMIVWSCIHTQSWPHIPGRTLMHPTPSTHTHTQTGSGVGACAARSTAQGMGSSTTRAGKQTTVMQSMCCYQPITYIKKCGCNGCRTPFVVVCVIPSSFRALPLEHLPCTVL